MQRKGSTTSPLEPPKGDACRIAVAVLQGKRRVPVKVHDLSTRGADIIGPLVLVAGQRISLVFDTEGISTVVLADVVHVDAAELLSDRVSVRFVEVTPESEAVLVRCMLHTSQASGRDHDADDDRVTARIPKHAAEPDVDAATTRVTKKKRR